MNDRLYRSRDERIIAGVAGGVAERFGMDPSLVRILWLILIPATAGAALGLYVIMAFVVPEEPAGDGRWERWERQAGGYQWPDPAVTPPPGAPAMAAQDGPAAATASDPAAGTAGLAGGAAVAASSAGAAGAAAPSSGSSGTLAGSGQPSTWLAPPASPTPTMSAHSSAQAPNPPWSGDPRSAREARRDARRAARAEHREGSGALLFGLILVVIGGYFFARAYIPDLDANRAWPILLIVLGGVLLLGAIRRGSDRSG